MSLLDGWHGSPHGGAGAAPGGRSDPPEPLGRGDLGETWVVRVQDKRLAAKRLHLPSGSGAAEVREALEPLTGLRDPALVPVLGIAVEGEEVWVRSELAPGVSLQRLLVVAVLTPIQVAAVVEGVCRGLDVLHRAGLGHGALHARNVHVDHEGLVRLGDGGIAPLLAGAGGRSRDLAGRPVDWPARDRSAAAALFQRTLEAGRRAGSAWRSPRAQALLDAIDALGRAAGPPELEAALGSLRQRAADCLDGSRVAAAAELGALVRRLDPGPGRARPWPPPEPAPAAVPSPATDGAPARLPALRPRGFRPARYAIVAGLAALVLAGVLVVRWTQGSAPRPSLRASPPPVARLPAPSSLPSSSPTPTPRPVPALAPGQAGPITGVEVQPLGACSPGARCAIRVTVRLAPSSTSVPLAWSFAVFDRCTGSLIELPGAQMSADPGWNYAYDTSYPTLPDGRSLALVAVTSAPARAASAPLLVPAGEPSC